MEQETNKRERYIVHIDENYLQTLYVQKNAVSVEDRMEVYNKVYNDIMDFLEGKSDKPDVLTEKDVYDYYQERSATAGDRADQLAWMFIVMMTGGLISGHAFQTFSICANLALIYLLLSVTQAVWQMFTSWIFKQQLARMQEPPKDYPSWVGGGAWFFYWAKMLTVASAVVYFTKAIFF